LTGRRPLRLESTRPAGHRTGAGRPLVLSSGGSRLTRAQAHSLVVPSRLWLARQQHFSTAGRRRRGRPRHVAPVDRRTGDISAPRRLGRRVFIGGDAELPRLPPLVTVVVTITLGDLELLVLRLACSAPLLHRSLILVKNRLLRERRLGRNKVSALQLQRQEGAKVTRGRQTPKIDATTKGE
jgi:hypothetical protein